MGKELEKDITRVRKSIQSSWDKIVALSYLHPELSEDREYMEVNSAVIYLSDVATQLANKHVTKKNPDVK